MKYEGNPRIDTSRCYQCGSTNLTATLSAHPSGWVEAYKCRNCGTLHHHTLGDWGSIEPLETGDDVPAKIRAEWEGVFDVVFTHGDSVADYDYTLTNAFLEAARGHKTVWAKILFGGHTKDWWAKILLAGQPKTGFTKVDVDSVLFLFQKPTFIDPATQKVVSEYANVSTNQRISSEISATPLDTNLKI